MALPNFLIGGGVAAGTSFLSSALQCHPDIYLPQIQRPEPNFFHYSWKFNKGLDWYQNSWFSNLGIQRAVGERSSLLLNSENAPERIRRSLPNIKLIFCLRNPIERAWANYRFTVLEGLEPLSFDDAIDHEELRTSEASEIWSEVQPHAYLYRSKYSAGLNRYFEKFDRKNILLIKSEELGKNPLATLQRVCDFLGVRTREKFNFPVNFSSPIVRDRSLQVELRAFFKDRFSELVECIRKEEIVSPVVISEKDKLMYEMLCQNLEVGKSILPENTRDKLRALLADEFIALRGLVDFSIDDWV